MLGGGAGDNYNLQFLNHTETSDRPHFEDDGTASSGGESVAEEDVRSDLEKQYEIIAYLQGQRSAPGMGWITPRQIESNLRIDLQGDDVPVAEMLLTNPKVRTETLADGTVVYGYQAKFNISNRTDLLAQINRCRNGVASKELSDTYDGVDRDLEDLLVGGDIIAVANREAGDRTLFPRGEPFYVELGGIIRLSNDKRAIFGESADMDYTKEIKRGEAVWTGNQWFRVSSAVKEGPLSDQPPRAQAPSSVTSIFSLPKKNEIEGYLHAMDEKHIPLDRPLNEQALQNMAESQKALTVHGVGAAASLLLNPTAMRKRPRSSNAFAGSVASLSKVQQNNGPSLTLSSPAMVYCRARRHGCTSDVRDMFLATKAEVSNLSECDLHQKLVKLNLIPEGVPIQRPRMKRSTGTEDGKPKKRRYYTKKDQKITNGHLKGTELGAILSRAAERQSQGKSVGDGGM
uniref:Transcription initiation factor IIE subunit beta n=1 Tax=Corethron hystrix TaxID=216773 RepID=A0A7S1BGZ2_9STRA|mmetsp:Transcript_27767/g.63612  ORF Transcript_27767/g.63612 Transcript_27767/m.63612 type:complete len:458 (+) Transcript_27767:45-1418(+)